MAKQALFRLYLKGRALGRLVAVPERSWLMVAMKQLNVPRKVAWERKALAMTSQAFLGNVTVRGHLLS